MQASFHPNETVQDVMDHVAQCLEGQFQGATFYLYVTPPTQKLAATKTLAELSLVPAALTYLSWLEMPPQAKGASIGFYLRRDLVIELEPCHPLRGNTNFVCLLSWWTSMPSPRKV
jgi:hypothetical protein